jgi:putative transcription factor
MTDCDMCGKKDIVAKQVKVEGTTMTVCATCAQFGTELTTPKQNNFSRPTYTRSNPDENLAVVDDYSKRIKHARESKKMTQAELAKKISEKESLLHNVESGHTKPNFKLARKLQKFFHIRLLEDMSMKTGSVEEFTSTKKAPLTMEEKVLAALKKK